MISFKQKNPPFRDEGFLRGTTLLVMQLHHLLGPLYREEPPPLTGFQGRIHS